MILTILLVFCIFQIGNSLDNGLARTPPMGWMHWQRYRCLTDCDKYPDECISENLFKKTADLMASEGYLDAGYQYVMIDDCWMAHERDIDDKLQPDQTRFPGGIKNLSKYIHNKGLKFGIYADFGTYTCAGYPGSLEYLELDAKTFAEWEVDYLKFDGCYSDTKDMEKGYPEMSMYLNQTGRPIVYSCSWPAYMEGSQTKPNYTALAKYCNLWRNWGDIDDSWSSVTSILGWFAKNQDRIAHFAGPGHWNDPDMLIIGNYGLSYDQSKSQMALWAILAAPLLMSVDLQKIKPEFKDILLNKKLIQVDQDPLGIQGRLVLEIDSISIWTRPITPIVDNATSYAIAFLSQRYDGYPYPVTTTLLNLGINDCEGYNLEDVFTDQKAIVTPSEDISVRVNPSGVVFLIATPLSFEFENKYNDF